MKLAFDIGGALLGSDTHFLYDLSGIGTLAGLILNAAIVLSGVVVLFMFIGGGISIISGAGASDPKRAAQGRESISKAVIGFVIIFASYWVIRLIELVTGVDFIF